MLYLKKNSDFIVKYFVHFYTKERNIYILNAVNIQLVTHKITEISILFSTLHTCYVKHFFNFKNPKNSFI